MNAKAASPQPLKQVDTKRFITKKNGTKKRNLGGKRDGLRLVTFLFKF